MGRDLLPEFEELSVMLEGIRGGPLCECPHRYIMHVDSDVELDTGKQIDVQGSP